MHCGKSRLEGAPIGVVSDPVNMLERKKDGTLGRSACIMEWWSSAGRCGREQVMMHLNKNLVGPVRAKKLQHLLYEIFNLSVLNYFI